MPNPRKRRRPEWVYIYNDTAFPLMSKKDAMDYLANAIDAHRGLSHRVILISKSMCKTEYLATDPVTRVGYSIIATHKRLEQEYSIELTQPHLHALHLRILRSRQSRRTGV